jgi:hypothetical protein
MSAPLLDENGKVLMGVDPNAYQVPGVDPQNPHAIASAFQRYSAESGAAGPAQPAPVAQVPHQSAGPAATPQNAPENEGQPQAEESDSDDESYTTDTLASFFEEGTTVDEVLGAIKHSSGDREFSLAEAIEGYIAQPDAAIVARQRNTLEAEFMSRDTARQELNDTAMRNLASITANLQAQIDADSDPASLQHLLAVNPEGYQQEITRIEAKKMVIANAEQGRRELEESNHRKGFEDHQRNLDFNLRSLGDKFPEWNDPAKGPVLKHQIEMYAQSLGYTAQEIAGMTDYRQILSLRDGAVASAIKTKGVKVLKDARDKKLPAPVGRGQARADQPGKHQMQNQGRADAFHRQQKSGSLDDTAAIFNQLTGTP